MYRAEVRIELKPGVADPEGANTKKALELLGFTGVQNVKTVHAFAIELDAASPDKAKAAVDEMCKRLLVNPVIHSPRVTVTNGSASANAGAKAKGGPKAKAKAPAKAKAKAATAKAKVAKRKR
jgi:phosphoribosylformylglycinamidine synthase subunit PurS